MSNPSPESKRNFPCSHCQKTITIPADLPPTTAPCPHCGERVTSPELLAVEGLPVVPSPVTAPVQEVPREVVPRVVRRELASQEELRRGNEEEPPASGSRSSAKWLLAGVACLVGLGAVAVAGKLLLGKGQDAPSPAQSASPLTVEQRAANAYEQKGWIPEAQQTLNAFLEARTPAERAQVTLSEASQLEAFYQEYPFDERDTSLQSFSPVSLGKEDTSRGLFLMNYNRPSQFAIKEFFRPIPPLRVRHGLEEPDPILMGAASLDNFVEEPMRVMAFFRRGEDGRLLIDWETFAQTKHRLLRKFVENPEPGKSEVFRVFVQEDVDFEDREGTGVSVFRVCDPANQEDYAKVLVRDSSEIGRAFAPLRWRGRAVRVAPKRNATIALTWSDEAEPQLQLGRMICWQFIGLGGEPGNWQAELAAREEAQAGQAGE